MFGRKFGFRGPLELVSKELNHMAPISMFLRGVSKFMKKKKIVTIFQKENGNTLTLLIICIVKSLQKEQNSTNHYYDLVTDQSSILPFCLNQTEHVNQSSVS